MPGVADHLPPLLIGGELTVGAGAPIAVENPFTTGTIVELPCASAEQVDAAVAAARESWTGWGRMPAGERRELGREGLEAFQETKHVHMEMRIERKEWWSPYSEYGAS